MTDCESVTEDAWRGTDNSTLCDRVIHDLMVSSIHLAKPHVHTGSAPVTENRAHLVQIMRRFKMVHSLTD